MSKQINVPGVAWWVLALTLDVPDGWRWDGAGWVEPEAENEKA